MRIYIGNISYSATESQLQDLLSPFNPVFEITYPVDSATGNHKGFAFATITDVEIAEKAIENLDGSEFEGRALRVKEAVQEDHSPSRGVPVGFRKSGEDAFRPGGGPHRRR